MLCAFVVAGLGAQAFHCNTQAAGRQALVKGTGEGRDASSVLEKTAGKRDGRFCEHNLIWAHITNLTKRQATERRVVDVATE